MFQQLGEELKHSRENRQLTPEQIASKLKIDLKFIHNMENGNFVFLPEIYVKAYLKEFAKAIGLDKDLIIKKYELAKQGKTLEQALEEEKKKQVEEQNQKEFSKAQKKIITDEHFEETNQISKKNDQNKKFILYISLGIAFVLVMIYFFFIKDASDEIVTEQPIEKIIEENKQRFEEQNESPLTNQSIAEDSLNLSFVAFDSVWCKVIPDNSQEVEFFLYPNMKYQISAENNFNLTIGNSGGVNLFLNEEELKFPQIKGKRIQLSIDRNGYEIIENQKSTRDSL